MRYAGGREMEHVKAQAKRCRERAEQTRTMAVEIRSDADRKILLDIAEEFDRMADDAES
jgi:hypothetical protein